MSTNPSDTSAQEVAQELLAAAKKLRDGRQFLGEDISTYNRDYLEWLGSVVSSVNPLADWLEAAAEGWRWADSLHDTDTHPAVLTARAINGTARWGALPKGNTTPPPFRDVIRERNAAKTSREALAAFRLAVTTGELTSNDYAAWVGRLAANIENLIDVIENLQAVADHAETTR